MNACIYYHPEAYTTSGPQLMGRNAAGESFLRGFLMHSTASEFWAQVQSNEHAQHFEQAVSAFGKAQRVRTVTKQSMASLAEPGLVYFPGPGIGEHAFHRTASGHGAWSLCGITHTTSSALAMNALAELITAPVQSWDALICTSAAVKSNVERLLQAQVDYLKDRLGITKLVLPQLPVIPLGIHTKDFAFDEAQKTAARQKLGVATDALVVLFTGRLSFHAKAHPLAMYQALETAARETGKPVVLIECGWHANEFIEKAFADAARLACPSVKVIVLDGRKATSRQTAWAGADVFCSLADNIQETFGIVPVEAMAAGLPVVVADWDGYRDTVRDGVDGFCIPTVTPSAGFGQDLALRHALEIDSYDMYCGHTSSLVAVDVQGTAKALRRLFGSPELRRQMGQAGRERARTVYDWSVIIPQYEALWVQLGELREKAKGLKPTAHLWPAGLDPFYAFATYPTRQLTEQTVLGLVDADVDTAISRTLSYRALAMIDFARAVLPSDPEIRVVLGSAGNGPDAAGALVSGISPARRAFVFRSLVWLLKLGVLEVHA